jgi:NAD(P) transhydrogenase subunit alpha
MLKTMRKGSVVVDLAAQNGGNCEATEPGKSVVKHGVTIHAPLNLPSELSTHASQMFAKNISNFIKELYKEDSEEFDFENQVINDTCIVHAGEIRNDLIKNAINEKGE